MARIKSSIASPQLLASCTVVIVAQMSGCGRDGSSNQPETPKADQGRVQTKDNGEQSAQRPRPRDDEILEYLRKQLPPHVSVGDLQMEISESAMLQGTLAVSLKAKLTCHEDLFERMTDEDLNALLAEYGLTRQDVINPETRRQELPRFVFLKIETPKGMSADVYGDLTCRRQIDRWVFGGELASPFRGTLAGMWTGSYVPANSQAAIEYLTGLKNLKSSSSARVAELAERLAEIFKADATLTGKREYRDWQDNLLSSDPFSMEILNDLTKYEQYGRIVFQSKARLTQLDGPSIITQSGKNVEGMPHEILINVEYVDSESNLYDMLVKIKVLDPGYPGQTPSYQLRGEVKFDGTSFSPWRSAENAWIFDVPQN